MNGGRRCPALEQRKLCACERDGEEEQRRAQDDNAERGECFKILGANEGEYWFFGFKLSVYFSGLVLLIKL